MYPINVWVETTTMCNAKCSYCPHSSMTRKKEVMSLETFIKIADKLKEYGIKLGCMSGIGEPLTDNTLCEKYDYAKKIGICRDIVGLNTNAILLKNYKWEKLLNSIDFITASCPNVYEEYETLTGLNWDVFYKNVTEFINYIREKKPKITFNIGINRVKGFDEFKVRKAFKDYKVNYVGDPGMEWGYNLKNVTYCDMVDENMIILVNGNCTTCCFDVNDENVFGNIINDSLEKILENFKKKDFPLCKRCDYEKPI